MAAPYDLDNLRLSDVSVSRVGAMYELTHLLVEGTCKDVTPKQRASQVRGMQVHVCSRVCSVLLSLTVFCVK